MNKNEELIVTIFGGWLGLHRFMKKDYKMGILYLFTGGLFCIGWLIDIIKCLTSKKEVETAPVKPKTYHFNCALENTNKYACHELVGLMKYLDLLDKDDMFEGMSDEDIEYTNSKIYENNGYSFPADILYENGNYVVRYTEHGKDLTFGIIPAKYNEKVNSIINNSNIKIIFGGMKYVGGYYKQYDFNDDKVKHGYDDVVIEISLFYEVINNN